MGIEPEYIVVEGKTFIKEQLSLDNHVFKNCTMDECQIYYSGGPYELIDTHITNSQLILNQRLVRKLCGQCQGAGCGLCLQTGYRGRVPLAEHLRVTPELRGSISAKHWGQLQAKPSLLEEAARLVAEGITDRREADRVLGRVTWRADKE